METKFKQFDFQPNSINNDERSVIITASTNQLDRYGDIIEPTSFKLEKIQTLPILFNHNSNSPVGKTLWAKITDMGLLLKIKISDKTQLARDVWELVKEGIISFASVGFIPLQWEENETGYIFKEVDLIETSLTPTPANPGAVALMMKNIQSPEIKTVFEKQIMEDEIQKLQTEIKDIKDSLDIFVRGEVIDELNNKIKELDEKVSQINKTVDEKKVEKQKIEIENIKNIQKRVDNLLKKIA